MVGKLNSRGMAFIPGPLRGFGTGLSTEELNLGVVEGEKWALVEIQGKEKTFERRAASFM